MSYDLEHSKQIYGNQPFLSHIIKNDDPELNRHLFGMRVPSYGIISFGAIGKDRTKSFKPIDNGIKKDIELVSVFAYTGNATADEITIYLYEGNVEIAEQKITSSQMPYRFPDGAIVNPNLTIWVKPRQDTSALMLYWRPVHVLSYIEVQ